MQAACKVVSPHLMYFFVVFSSLLASSFAVSPEDKKWLLDTLLSLRHELRHRPDPTYSPQWEASDPLPIPTPKQWMSKDTYDYAFPTIALPSIQPDVVHKRNYQLGRMSSFGLLCCNFPPTRPPRMKRPKYNAESRWRSLVLNAIAKSFNDRTVDASSDRIQNVERRAGDVNRPFLSYLDAEEASLPEVQRRGVTVVKGGVSGINTG